MPSWYMHMSDEQLLIQQYLHLSSQSTKEMFVTLINYFQQSKSKRRKKDCDISKIAVNVRSPHSTDLYQQNFNCYLNCTVISADGQYVQMQFVCKTCGMFHFGINIKIYIMNNLERKFAEKR